MGWLGNARHIVRWNESNRPGGWLPGDRLEMAERERGERRWGGGDERRGAGEAEGGRRSTSVEWRASAVLSPYRVAVAAGVLS